MKIKFGSYWQDDYRQFAVGFSVMKHHPSHVDIIFDFAFWFVEITIGDDK